MTSPDGQNTCLEDPFGDAASECTKVGQPSVVESAEQLATVNISRSGKNTHHSTLSQFHDEMVTFSNLVLVISGCAGNFMCKRKPTGEHTSLGGEQEVGPADMSGQDEKGQHKTHPFRVTVLVVSD